jgi:spore coat protein U-like protein
VLTYPDTGIPLSCPNIPIDNSVSLLNFKVTAGTTAPKAACTVSASAIDFGQHGSLGSIFNANGTVTVNCLKNTPYSLSMDRGRGAGASVLNRLMTRSGGTNTIRYSLYADPAYSNRLGRRKRRQPGDRHGHGPQHFPHGVRPHSGAVAPSAGQLQRHHHGDDHVLSRAPPRGAGAGRHQVSKRESRRISCTTAARGARRRWMTADTASAIGIATPCSCASRVTVSAQ